MATKIIYENPLQMGKPLTYNETLNKISIKDSLKKQFIRVLQSMTEYEGLPESMPKHLYERYMLEFGWTCVTEVEGKLYAFMGGLGGELNAYYLPTICVVSNPYLKFSKELEIGKECIIAMNDSYMQGVGIFFDYLTQLLTENYVTMNMYGINKRIPAVFQTSDSNIKDSIDNYLNKIYEGKISAVVGQTLFESLKTLPYENSSRMDFKQLIEYHQYILSLCYNYCGLDATFNMKREYVGSHETSINHAALHAWVDDMMEFREENCKNINDMYGTKIKVRLSSGWSLDRMLENIRDNKTNIISDQSENLDEETERNNLLNKLKGCE